MAALKTGLGVSALTLMLWTTGCATHPPLATGSASGASLAESACYTRVYPYACPQTRIYPGYWGYSAYPWDPYWGWYSPYGPYYAGHAYYYGSFHHGHHGHH